MLEIAFGSQSRSFLFGNSHTYASSSFPSVVKEMYKQFVEIANTFKATICSRLQGVTRLMCNLEL